MTVRSAACIVFRRVEGLAGSSSRMGQSKQLLVVDSKPLLRKITEEALAVEQSKVVVVLGANSIKHKKVINDLPVDNDFP